MIRCILPFVAILAWSTAAAAQKSDWWHGSYIWEGSGSSCDSSDTLTTYRSGEVFPWETECKILQETKIRGMDGILLDLECTYPDEPDGSFRERQLLLKIDDQTVYRYPDSRRLKRCPVENEKPETLEPALSACEWNDKIWITLKENAVRQELQFTGGVTSGEVLLSEYRDGQLAWVATGEFGCSNGASVCYLKLPATDGDGEWLPFELLEADGGSEYLIVPSLSQTYYSFSKSINNSYKYFGVRVDWQPGFTSEESEVILPSNIYLLSRCASK